MATKKSPSSDPEAKVAEPQAPVIEAEVPSPEVEAGELPDETTADPFEGRTTEDILKGLAEARKDDFEAFTRTNWEEGRRHGQGEATKQLEADNKKRTIEGQALATFDHWERKRLSDDPYETQEFAKAIDHPEVRAAYDLGKKLKQGPPVGEVIQQNLRAAMDSIFEPLKNHPTLKEMTDQEHNAIYEEFKGQPDPFTQFTKRYCELIIERGIAAGRTKDGAKSLQDAREEGRREAYDEAGLEYPGEPVEGRKAPKPGSAQDLRKQYADGDIDTATYNKKMIAIGASP